VIFLGDFSFVRIFLKNYRVTITTTLDTSSSENIMVLSARRGFLHACMYFLVYILIPWLTRFLLFQQGRFITYFPHYPCVRFCLLNFPGKFRRKQRISLSSNFPLHAWWGKFRRQKRTSLHASDWRAVPLRKSSAQLWTVCDDTVPYTFEQSLCHLLFPNLEHYNCGRKFRLCACLKLQWTRRCVSARAYIWNVFVPQS
jgi:hypothetical protein